MMFCRVVPFTRRTVTYFASLEYSPMLSRMISSIVSGTVSLPPEIARVWHAVRTEPTKVFTSSRAKNASRCSCVMPKNLVRFVIFSSFLPLSSGLGFAGSAGGLLRLSSSSISRSSSATMPSSRACSVSCACVSAFSASVSASIAETSASTAARSSCVDSTVSSSSAAAAAASRASNAERRSSMAARCSLCLFASACAAASWERLSNCFSAMVDSLLHSFFPDFKRLPGAPVTRFGFRFFVGREGDYGNLVQLH